jgi:hypothetical protein
MTLTVLGSAGLIALLIVAVAAIGRRSFWVRQLAFPLYGGPEWQRWRSSG